MKVAVDFDNCLIEYANDPLSGYFVMKPHAKEVIEKHHKKGVVFVLNTSRYGTYLSAALHFIERENIPVTFERTESKIKADLYIDDNNIFCDEIDWQKIDNELERLECV